MGKGGSAQVTHRGNGVPREGQRQPQARGLGQNHMMRELGLLLQEGRMDTWKEQAASPVRHDSCHSCCTRVTQAWGPAPTCRPLWPWETHPQQGTGNGTGTHVNSLTSTHHQMHPSMGARLSVGELRKLGAQFLKDFITFHCFLRFHMADI